MKIFQARLKSWYRLGGGHPPVSRHRHRVSMCFSKQLPGIVPVPCCPRNRNTLQQIYGHSLAICMRLPFHIHRRVSKSNSQPVPICSLHLPSGADERTVYHLKTKKQRFPTLPHAPLKATRLLWRRWQIPEGELRCSVISKQGVLQEP